MGMTRTASADAKADEDFPWEVESLIAEKMVFSELYYRHGNKKRV
jgi:hypothetical protein